MSDQPEDTLQALWQKEISARKEAQRWGTLSDIGFIGLVGAEMPEFFTKGLAKKPAWRLPLFVTSGVSVAVGVVMGWIKGDKAECLRDSALMIEHGQKSEPDAHWREKIHHSHPNDLAK